MMKPVRNAMKSEYFKMTDDGNVIPCEVNDEGAYQMNLMEIKEPEKLILHDITMENVKKSLETIKPSVGQEDLEEHERFTMEFGEGEDGIRMENRKETTQKKENKNSKKKEKQVMVL
jgi:hypothetical protein